MIIKHQISNFSYILLVISCILLAVGCGGKKQIPPQTQMTQTQVQQQQEQEKTPTETTATKTPRYVVISVKTGETNLGKIKIELYTKEAPKTCENFVKLTEKGFYNSLTFHRVIPGFVIQGGDPNGDGTGGPGYTVPAEISPNLKHIRGAVATARQGDQVNPTKASSGSQFYICHVPTPNLDGNYTIFGKVVEGMDVVDAIANVPTSKPGDRPLTPVIMEKVTVEY